MLGWNISVHRVINEVSIRRSFADALLHPERKAIFEEGAVGERVAVWQAGLYGLDWITDAAGRDGGIDLSRNGYPNWYLVRAADVLPTIRDRQPYKAPMYESPVWSFGEADILLPWWLGQTTINDEALNGCDQSEWLLVVAWDES